MNNELIAGSGGRGGGKGGSSAQTQAVYVPKTAADSLNSVAYANILDGLCEGEIGGLVNGIDSVYINNTPVRSGGVYNFNNLSVAWRNGTQSQEYIVGQPSTQLNATQQISTEIGVNVVVRQPNPIVQTITDAGVNSVRVTLTFPAFQQQQNNGDITAPTDGVQFQISKQSMNSNGTQGSYVVVLDKVVTGRTGDPWQASYLVDLNNSIFPVNIKVERITADTTSTSRVDSFSWTSLTLIKNARLTYPNTAYVALRVDAAQFNAIPSRSYLIKGLKIRIPSNATVDSTTGALLYPDTPWDGTFAAATYTNDPAWCLFDLLTSRRYGFGDFILTDEEKANTGAFSASNLDKYSFYAASRYCSALNTRTGSTNDYSATGKHGVSDGYGGFEPRFSLNVNIQQDTDAYQLINDLSSVFRAMPYWSAGSLTIAQDAPATPVYLFTNANVSPEGFKYVGSSQKTRATVVTVKYFDIEKRDYLYEAVESRSAVIKYGVTQKNVEGFGCTSRGQARRLGEWILESENGDTDVINFTTSMDAGIVVRPGSVISVADDLRAGVRIGGRIKTASTTTLVVDSPLSGSGSIYISVMLSNGTIETRQIQSLNGTTITVSTAFSSAPPANAVWTYTSPEAAPTQWRVISVQEKDDIEYNITALLYNATKYDYAERYIPFTPVINDTLVIIPNAPTNFMASEQIYSSGGQVKVKLSVTWSSVQYANKYEVSWRLNGGNWSQTFVSGPAYENPDITNGLYEFAISAVSSDGRSSTTSLSGSISAIGKTAPPSDVTGFTYSTDASLGPSFKWNAVSDLDLSTYEIRRGDPNDTWDNSIFVAQVKATIFKLPTLTAGSYTYRIKAVDTQSISSVNAATAVVVISLPVAPAIAHTISGTTLTLSWSAPTLTSYVANRFLLYVGNTFATKTLLTEVAALTYSLPIDWVGSKTFWIVARDNADQLSTNERSTTVLITPAGAPTNIVAKWTSSGYSLTWVPPTSTNSFQVYQYDIRYTGTGETESWATGTSLGFAVKNNYYSASITVFDKFYPGTTRRYWIMPQDRQSNNGVAGYVDLVYVPWGAPTVQVKPDAVLGNVSLSASIGTVGSLSFSYFYFRKAEITVANPDPQFTDAAIANSGYQFSSSPIRIPQSSGKKFRYFVAVIDAGGGYGIPGTGVYG
jgi:predicted phage tail protein